LNILIIDDNWCSVSKCPEFYNSNYCILRENKTCMEAINCCKTLKKRMIGVDSFQDIVNLKKLTNTIKTQLDFWVRLIKKLKELLKKKLYLR
jgi:hypothetical protein